MTVDEVRAMLAEHWDELRSMGVVSLKIFGSVARGEAGPESDVDLLVDLDPEQRISLLDYAHIKCELEDMLGCEVDLVERAAVRPRWQGVLEEEAVDAS